jgi:hypothetical protein
MTNSHKKWFLPAMTVNLFSEFWINLGRTGQWDHFQIQFPPALTWNSTLLIFPTQDRSLHSRWKQHLNSREATTWTKYYNSIKGKTRQGLIITAANKPTAFWAPPCRLSLYSQTTLLDRYNFLVPEGSFRAYRETLLAKDDTLGESSKALKHTLSNPESQSLGFNWNLCLHQEDQELLKSTGSGES